MTKGTVVSAHPLDASNANRTDPARVIDDMKRLAVEQLGALPGGLYGPVEEALRSPSASADSLHDHAALLLLRQHSASHVMRFRQHIALGFDDFGGATRPRAAGAPLGLIDESLLDFHLAGQRLGEILDQRYQQPLGEMKGRLGAVAAALHLAPGVNPLAPSRLATAFIEAIGDAELPSALQGLLFQHYQLELVRVLDVLYPRINGVLASAGYGARELARRTSPMQADRGAFRHDDQVAPRFPPPAGAAAGGGNRGAT